jgi:hypothetical protein
MPALRLEYEVAAGFITFTWQYWGGAMIMCGTSGATSRSLHQRQSHEFSTLAAAAAGLAVGGVAKGLCQAHLSTFLSYVVSAGGATAVFVWVRRWLIDLEDVEGGRRPTRG